MIKRRPMARLLSIGAGAVLSFLLALSGCENKPEGLSDKDCSGLRSQAFKLIAGGEGHAGHGCATDADCKETTWPECRRAVNKRYFDEISALEQKFDDGKCKETTPECKDSPPVFCKQGLCAMKEPGEKRD
ncbi:MAG: hypothetical protein IPM79_03110 [Polyangiaceae bacterium]|jgi:hypothetical protein|nr:hypothetical protein [Polyangiaceae bacterium]MBK8936652.1 hypothetical protein [Polyangiaceae bacterium]